MPSAPPRVCARCGKATAARRPCSCRPAFEGSRHPSGNDRRWQKVRNAYMAEHSICEIAGCRRVATDCDHIVALAEGGSRYDPGNLMALCGPHHTEKTARDARRGKTRLR